MKQEDKIKKFLKTNPSVTQILEFIETEAQRRVTEIKEQETKAGEARLKNSMEVWFKKDPENIDYVRRWAKDTSNEVLNYCAKEALRVTSRS